jgi:hypothetical protein
MTDKLLMALASTVIPGSESHGTHDLILLSDCSRSLCLFSMGSCPRYIPSKRTVQKTQLPNIPTLFSDVLSGLSSSDGPNTVDVGACSDCPVTLFTRRCLAMENFSGFAIPAFSRNITILMPRTLCQFKWTRCKHTRHIKK